MKENLISIGSWNFTPREKGIGIYSLDSGKLLQRILPEVNVGQQFYDRQRGIIYITHESDKRYATGAPGGDVIALKVESKTGKIAVLNEVSSFGSKPSYVWKDCGGDFLLVSHHAGRNPIVCVEKNKNGEYETVFRYDDTTLVLYYLNEDGSIGKPCDVLNYWGTNVPGLHCRSHLHCIVGNADGSLYAACDKGLDRVYTYRLDRERGKLIQLDTVCTKDGSAPRYAVFHPELPLVYVNHEELPVINTYRYDNEGKLTLLDAALMLDIEAKTQPSDLLISPNGKMLYATLRGIDQIAAFRLGHDGIPVRVQNICCGGKTPRGITISPDGTYLLSANQDSDQVSMLRILPDGMLGEAQTIVTGNCPGNLCIWQEEAL